MTQARAVTQQKSNITVVPLFTSGLQSSQFVINKREQTSESESLGQSSQVLSAPNPPLPSGNQSPANILLYLTSAANHSATV